MVFALSEEERRRFVESSLLYVVSNYGGKTIVAGAPMQQMVQDLTDEAESLGRRGFLPPSDVNESTTT